MAASVKVMHLFIFFVFANHSDYFQWKQWKLACLPDTVGEPKIKCSNNFVYSIEQRVRFQARQQDE